MRLLRRARRPPGNLEPFADGRVWRLERGRDFDGSVYAFRSTLRESASSMGKTVRAVPDKLEPHKFLWVQFGAGRVQPGDACVCGGTTIERVHRHYARCATCGSLLELLDTSLPEQPAVGASPAAAAVRVRPPVRTPLDAYETVALYRHRLDPDGERCYGIGRNAAGMDTFLAVLFPLDDGRRIPHSKIPGIWFYKLYEVPAKEMQPLLELADLEQGVRVSWRIGEDPGPRGGEEPALSP